MITAIINTNFGEMKIELYDDMAPLAVENFVTHSKNGFYNGIIFHRVIEYFMIQTGDPTGSGMGGESIWGDEFIDEFTGEVTHEKGVLSMANRGPDTNTSQFFIVHAESTPWLDGKHTIFGKVIEGMDVVDDIARVRVDMMDKPLYEVKIESIEIDE